MGATASTPRTPPRPRELARPPPAPRSARVNLLRWSVTDALAWLAKPPTGAGVGALAARVDPVLPDVLVFAPGTDLHAHPLVDDGRLVLQSRSSCMPAHALAPGRGSTVLDACAAPGNKTTHLAGERSGGGGLGGGGWSRGGAVMILRTVTTIGPGSWSGPQHDECIPYSSFGAERMLHFDPRDALFRAVCGPGEGATDAPSTRPPFTLSAMVGPGGRVFAVDRDAARLATLQRSVDRAGAGAIVTPLHANFLALDPADPRFAAVSAILLDPSCSGSGTHASRLDGLLPSAAAGEGAADAGRLARLAAFQASALKHALAFPAAARVTYSTCSVHAAENEAVVAAVLPTATAAGWRLERALPAWPRRGWGAVCPGGDATARVDPAADGTDGFFVALFVRDA